MAGLVFLAGAGIAYYNKQHETHLELVNRIEEEGLDFENSIPIKLLPLEVTSALMQTPKSTITFFTLPTTGEKMNYKEVSTKLQQAVIGIVQKNQWLSGFVAKRPDVDAEFQLWYTPSEDLNIIVKERGIFTDVLEQQPQQQQDEDQNQEKKMEREEQPFSLHQPYSTWLERTKELRVLSSEEILNRKSKPLWKVSLLPTYDDSTTKTTEGNDNHNNKPTEPTGFALVISMCHSCGDYHTFYQLYGMVVDSLLHSNNAGENGDTTDMTITKLNPFRHPDFEEQAAKRLGYEEVHYLNKANPAMWESKSDDFEAEVLAFTVSKTWIEENSNKVNTPRRSPLGKSRFVDATIISWFLNLVQPTIGFYANSLRDFLDVIDDRDCGNYINPIPLTPEDYATAWGVQHSLLTGKRSSCDVPLPKYFDDSGLLTFGFAVNWLGHANRNNTSSSSSSSSNTNEAGDTTTTDEGRTTTVTTDNIQQELHMPLYAKKDLQNLPSRVSGIILFEPNPGQIGLYCICKKSIAESIIQSGIIDKALKIM